MWCYTYYTMITQALHQSVELSRNSHNHITPAQYWDSYRYLLQHIYRYANIKEKKLKEYEFSLDY